MSRAAEYNGEANSKGAMMPIHDWSRAPAGLFHHFHQRWSGDICDALNAGRLPEGYFALVEQRAAGLEPDVLTLREGDGEAPGRPDPGRGGGIALVDVPPKARFVSRATEEESYAMKANRVVVKDSTDRTVAVIEIISPGNKGNRYALNAFVDKTHELLREGISVMVIDLFPPSARDPQGIHPLIWNDIRDDPFPFSPDTPLTLAAYAAAPPVTAYVESVAVGDALPDMPVFLDRYSYVLAPLEATYRTTWEKCPPQFKQRVLGSATSA